MITTSGDAAKETSSSKTTDSNPTSGQHDSNDHDSSSKGISFSSNALDSINSSAISSAVKDILSSNDIFGGSISRGEHDATNATTKTPTSDNSTYGNKISVDSVFGTGVNGHASASTSGNYQAYANEKSNVDSQTFNNQPEVTVTPISAMVNKGTVSNNDISSVDGLLMTNKDKESEEVLDSTKRRNQNEEDETAGNKMRDYIRGINDKADTSTDEEKAATDEFKLGNDKYDDDAKKEIAAVDKEMNLETEKERIKVQALANQVSELTKQKDEIVRSLSMPPSDPNIPSDAPVIGNYSIKHNTDGTATITTENAGSVTLTKEEVDAAAAKAGDALSGTANALVDKILSTKEDESDKANIDAVNQTRANVAARMEKVNAIQKKYDDMRTADSKATTEALSAGADVKATDTTRTAINDALTSGKDKDGNALTDEQKSTLQAAKDNLDKYDTAKSTLDSVAKNAVLNDDGTINADASIKKTGISAEEYQAAVKSVTEAINAATSVHNIGDILKQNDLNSSFTESLMNGLTNQTTELKNADGSTRAVSSMDVVMAGATDNALTTSIYNERAANAKADGKTFEYVRNSMLSKLSESNIGRMLTSQDD